MVNDTVYYDNLHSQLSSNKITGHIEIKFIDERHERVNLVSDGVVPTISQKTVILSLNILKMARMLSNGQVFC